ncbi:hypothetical protein MSAS_38090 [Mycobacterium saskatchewanense]|uniref:Uncharacterized protein n=1 Tax=Mycobacterium saskatchewanense TaxID=220927 RepID=A0AAJ3NL89_9MYCO|nr:hypothetical protein [Mycobacterium saskatchewanense]ORW67506.1 hypothetical protein AWC23_22650 [Mycobacterium saskatchewanense]BBX64635.1 hypothetical protein MSAS_38090 [Mycobacterium saskatchewanense]
MDLKWPAVLIVGLVALVAALAVGMLAPMPKITKVLRPLAHVERLTGMPEYARVARVQYWSMLITLVLLVAVFVTSLLTTSRPTGFTSASRNFEAVHPEDIMVCVGQPVTDPTTAGFLNYFDDQLKSYHTQRIGLTSPTLRVVPLTRDYTYAGSQFGRYADMAALQHQLDTAKELPGPQADELRAGINDFSRQVAYVDYARSVEDILALCMTGFPSFEDKSTHRRSLIYLGYSDFRGTDETRPSLYSDQQIKDMATRAGVQINVINRADVVKSPEQSNQALAAIAGVTNGRYSVYNPAGTAGASGTDPTLAALLDKIRANPPNVVLPSGTVVTSRSWDYPNVPLLGALLMASLLFVSLAVLRR